MDDAVIGNINVSKTIDELQEKGFVVVTTRPWLHFKNGIKLLVKLHGYLTELSFDKVFELMRCYSTNYMRHDMDKTLFLSVASNRCLQLYADTHVLSSSGETCPITLLRLIVESEVETLQLRGKISHTVLAWFCIYGGILV